MPQARRPTTSPTSTARVVWSLGAKEFELIVNELTIWANKMEDHAKTLKAGREKAKLTNRVHVLRKILDER